MLDVEFMPGMKLSLGGEFGVVVVSELNESDFYGIIRWDTINENDLKIGEVNLELLSNLEEGY